MTRDLTGSGNYDKFEIGGSDLRFGQDVTNYLNFYADRCEMIL